MKSFSKIPPVEWIEQRQGKKLQNIVLGKENNVFQIQAISQGQKANNKSVRQEVHIIRNPNHIVLLKQQNKNNQNNQNKLTTDNKKIDSWAQLQEQKQKQPNNNNNIIQNDINKNKTRIQPQRDYDYKTNIKPHIQILKTQQTPNQQQDNNKSKQQRQINRLIYDSMLKNQHNLYAQLQQNRNRNNQYQKSYQPKSPRKTRIFSQQNFKQSISKIQPLSKLNPTQSEVRQLELLTKEKAKIEQKIVDNFGQIGGKQQQNINFNLNMKSQFNLNGVDPDVVIKHKQNITIQNNQQQKLDDNNQQEQIDRAGKYKYKGYKKLSKLVEQQNQIVFDNCYWNGQQSNDAGCSFFSSIVKDKHINNVNQRDQFQNKSYGINKKQRVSPQRVKIFQQNNNNRQINQFTVSNISKLLSPQQQNRSLKQKGSHLQILRKEDSIMSVQYKNEQQKQQKVEYKHFPISHYKTSSRQLCESYIKNKNKVKNLKPKSNKSNKIGNSSLILPKNKILNKNLIKQTQIQPYIRINQQQQQINKFTFTIDKNNKIKKQQNQLNQYQCSSLQNQIQRTIEITILNSINGRQYFVNIQPYHF